MESVTIVSNGSLIRESWFQEFGECLDILAISCDSDNLDTLWKIGRYVRQGWYAENSSKTTRRMQLVENNSSKIKGGKLVEN